MKRLIIKYKDIIMYLIFGVLTTLISWVTYSIFTILFKNLETMMNIFGLEVSLMVFLSKILSWIIAVLFAYVTNKLWVFNSKSWKFSLVMREFWSFIAARIVTGVIEIVCVPLLVSLGLDQTIFGIEGMLANVIVCVVVIILNYVFSKLFVFTKKKEKDEEQN